jgi:hypothetical protein
MHRQPFQRQAEISGMKTRIGLQQHCPRLVGMLSENRHQNIHDPEGDATQYANAKPIHGKVCTLANQKPQVRESTVWSV